MPSLTLRAGLGGTLEGYYDTTGPYPPGTYTVDPGLQVSVKAIPDSGYVFDHWETDPVTGVHGSTANPVSGAMPDYDLVLTAVFMEVPPPPPPTAAAVIIGAVVLGLITIPLGYS